MKYTPFRTGTLYGLLIGIIPSAGATTGLGTLFGFISYLVDQPLLGCHILYIQGTFQQQVTLIQEFFLEYPIANSAAATMVDGFPSNIKKAGFNNFYAITAAVTTNTVNGLLWELLPLHYYLCTQTC